ncbi:MAG: sialidase family protein [Sedimentisphaerales bacterium]
MSSKASSENLQVCVGEDVVIIPLHKNPGPVVHMKKLANGDIVVNTNLGVNTDLSMPTGKRSRDGGQTWEDATCMRSKDGGKTWNKGNLEIGDSAFEFSDGEIVMFRGWFGKETEKDGIYAFPFCRWTNGSTKQLDEETTMVLPQRVLKDQKTRSQFGHGFVELFPNHSIIQLRDGSLMASVQGLFPYDACFPRGWRVFVVRSTDRGRTWNYLSTVATDFETKFSDGFCEPVLLPIPNGDILCIMRTGGDCENPHDPIHLSISKDDGMSWGQAMPITEFGVYPNAILMENGVIALCYGKPGNWMVFSLDYGKTWGNAIKINDAPESVDAGHYNSLVEVEPGKLLLGYAQGDPKVLSRASQDHTHSEIHGTFIYVKRLDK